MMKDLPGEAAGFLDWMWPEYGPYYQELAARPLDRGNVGEWLSDWSRLGRTVAEAGSRIQLAYARDTADPEAEKRFHALISELYPQVEAAEQKLRQKLLASGLAPARFDIPLRNMRAEAEIFREANLPLLTEERKLGSEYDKIMGAQTVTWDGREMTLPQMRSVRLDPDRSLRERAWRLAAERALADRETIDELWRKSIAVRRRIASNTGLPDYRAYKWRELLRFDYTPEDARSFHRAIEEVAVPAASRIYDRARRRLGVDRLRPWDVDLDRNPISVEAARPFRDSSELAEKAVTVFEQVDPKLGGYYKLMRQEGLLDLDNRKGKAPGAFCTSFPVAKRPFVFMNAVGIRGDVRTMLHECGHAFHVFETVPLPYIQQLQVTMEFAEVASMSMELLAGPYLDRAHGGFYDEREFKRDRIEHLEQLNSFA